MTPDDHYRAAEHLLELAEAENDGGLEDRLVARAHVHAVLATRATAPVAAPRKQPVSGLAEFLKQSPPKKT